MTTGHFAALLARARGRVTGIRPHAAARYAWADAAAEVETLPQTSPDNSLPAATPKPPARTPPSTAPSAIAASALLQRDAAAITYTESPDCPTSPTAPPAQPLPVGAGLPAITASTPAGHIAGKPAPTPPAPMHEPSAAPTPAIASTPPTDVTARPQRPTHSPAIGQTREPRHVAADTPAEVHVHIGRIEVIAPAPPPTSAGHAEGRPPARRPLSLDDYLAGRRNP